MTITELRMELNLTYGAFGAEIGLKSRGQVCKLEKPGARCSVAVALQIERLSAGRIPAAQLNPDIALLERTRLVS